MLVWLISESRYHALKLSIGDIGGVGCNADIRKWQRDPRSELCRSIMQAATESFSTYVERVKIFYAANDVAEDKQMPVYLSVIGAKNFALL